MIPPLRTQSPKGFPAGASVRTIRPAINHVLDEARTARAAVAELSQASRRRPAGVRLHPFQLYQVPRVFRNTDDDEGNPFWRRFTVRSGRIGQFALIGVGCDSYDANPHGEFIPSTASPDEVTVNATGNHWFWAYNTGALAILYNAPEADLQVGHEFWPGWPEASPHVYPIGYVDPVTYAAENRCIVRQLLASDVPLTVGFCRPAEYNHLTTYPVGSIVVVSPDNVAVVSGINGRFAVPGTWIAKRFPSSGQNGAEIPLWPPSGYSETQPIPPDAPSVYWWPLQLFAQRTLRFFDKDGNPVTIRDATDSPKTSLVTFASLQ